MSSQLRFEKKIKVEYPSKNILEALIFNSPLRFRPIYHERIVNNIYFDTMGFDSLLDNFDGNPERVKLRLRWYDDSGVIKQPVLEVKTKFSDVGSKLHYKVSTSKDHIGMCENLMMDILQSVPVNVGIELKKSKPSLINSYRRSYFQGSYSKVRVTVDDKLAYKKPYGSGCVKLNGQILEIKYDSADSNLVEQLTNNIPHRVEKFSKYARGMQLLYGH